MKFIQLISWFGALFSLSATAGDAPNSYMTQKPPILLKVGEQKSVNIDGLRKFSVGSSHAKAVSVPDLKDQLLIKGISSGLSHLIVWTESGGQETRQIRVVADDEKGNMELLESLAQLSEVEVIQTASRTLLRGEIRSIKEASLVSEIVNKWGEVVTDTTAVEPKLLLSAESKIQAWVKSSKYASTLWVERVGEDLWVRGHLETQAVEKAVVKQLHDLAPFSKFDLNSLPDQAQTIYFKVFLLELKRSSFESFGISWPKSMQGVFKLGASGLQGLTDLTASIQALSQEGQAKILSNPELVVSAPGDAELFSGGEVPISVTNQWDSHVEWKPFGLFLKLHVTHVVGPQVRLDIKAGVSHVEKNTGDAFPNFYKNEMNQHIEARFGEPLFLSGLLKEEMRQSASGLSLLRKIPIFGSLFGSEDFRNSRSELVAILYPYSNPPKAPLERTLPKELKSLSMEWMSPQDERLLRSSKEYPWNVLDQTNEDGVYFKTF